MKATLTTAAALVLFGTTTGFSAQNADRADRPVMQADQAEREVQRERNGRRGPGIGKAAMLERFDADGDGELSEAERATAKESFKAKREQMKARLLERFDANGDGEHTPADFTAFEISHRKVLRYGELEIGAGVSRLEDRLTGVEEDDRRLFVSWRMPF